MINLRLFLSCLLSLILGFIASESILKKKETPSYIPSELWTMCLVAMEITYPLASWTDKHDSIPRFPITKKNVIIPYVVNHLYNLYGTHWWRLQCIISWLFWLWIMAVTWLYLPLTFSRLDWRNVQICSWAVKWSCSQSCPTLCDPIDCSVPGSSVHGIFQATVLEWIAISFSRGSSQPRAWTQVSRIVDRRFTVWATKEVLSLVKWKWSHSVVSYSLRPHRL